MPKRKSNSCPGDIDGRRSPVPMREAVGNVDEAHDAERAENV